MEVAPGPAVKMQQEFKSNCVRAFRNATQKDGLTPEDYKVAVLELLGYKPSKYEVASVWETYVGVASSHKGVGLLQLENFVSIMLERLQQKDKNELVREIFMTMDRTQRGFLTEADCLAVFGRVAPTLRKEVVKVLFEEVDSDGDGRISYRDFEIMMKSITPHN